MRQRFSKKTLASMQELNSLREQFRQKIALEKRPAKFDSRIGVVLAGGGARGAYEAGALMAFQDARIPTHIITAASVGSINAASYAAGSRTTVGNAEKLVQSWLELTPAVVGIDWFRYILILFGLIAASAGIGNFLRQWMEDSGIYFHFHNAKLTWLSLAAAGVTVLFSADRLPYVGHLCMNLLRGKPWELHHRKAWISIGANIVVWGFVIFFLNSTHVHLPLNGHPYFELSASPLVLAGMLFLLVLHRLFLGPLSKISHRFLRLPLRTGLFTNFERTKFLRDRIPQEALRQSPIRVIMTATDLNHGSARFFSNAPLEQLLSDACVHEGFVRHEVEYPPDLVQAAVASSSFTFAYEVVPMDGRSWTDGGVVANQPIRPALRLGADVLFLVMMTPLEGEESGEIKTFIDVGIHAVDILVSKNIKSDIAMLNSINRLCLAYATELGVKPEQLELEIGRQRYRYVRSFNIAPETPLPAATMDFDADILGPVILQGYREAAKVVSEFLEYELTRPARESRRVVRLAAERVEGNFRTTMA